MRKAWQRHFFLGCDYAMARRKKGENTPRRVLGPLQPMCKHGQPLSANCTSCAHKSFGKKKKKTSREDNIMPAGLVVSTPELFRLRQGKPGRKARSRGCCFSLHWGSSLRGVSPTEMPQRWPSASELRKLGFLRRPWRVRFIQSTHTG